MIAQMAVNVVNDNYFSRIPRGVEVLSGARGEMKEINLDPKKLEN